MHPPLANAIAVDLWRFTPADDRMQVLEARPLLLFNGEFSLGPVWLMFRTGFIVGLVAIVVFMISYGRRQRGVDLLFAVWGIAMYLATLGQNRFGYYLVPIVAVLTGCISAWSIEAGRRAGGWRRDAAVIAVAAAVFGANLVPALWTTGRSGGLPTPWLPAFAWLREQTPEPFGDPEYYFARYGGEPRRLQSSVLAWWDYGYWITQVAHRVPTANPTQAGAAEAGYRGNSARFRSGPGWTGRDTWNGSTCGRVSPSAP
jgi:dolichyl-diphosphooligosaccharide--protein glycosyltransferase